MRDGVFLSGMEFAAAVCRGDFDIPLQEIAAKRAEMESRGMSTWIIGREQFVEFARTDGFHGWLDRNGYEPHSSEAWFPVEMSHECQMLLGALKVRGDA